MTKRYWLDLTRQECFAALYRKFPTSVRVQRLSAMRLEAKGAYGKAEDTYKDILEKDPTDQVRGHAALILRGPINTRSIIRYH